MAILSRISRLLVSDMHAVLERMEEPELVLKQAIREMEEALHAQQQRAQLVASKLRRVQRSGTEIEARLLDLTDQLDVSIGAERLDTARVLVRRKLEAEALQASLAARAAELEEERTGLCEGIARHRDELQALREKVALLCEAPEPGNGDAPGVEVPVRVDDQDVEAALLREIERRRSS